MYKDIHWNNFYNRQNWKQKNLYPADINNSQKSIVSIQSNNKKGQKI